MRRVIGAEGSPPPPKADPWPEDRVPSPFEHDVIEVIGSLVSGELATYCTHAAVQVPLLEAEGHRIIDRRLL